MLAIINDAGQTLNHHQSPAHMKSPPNCKPTQRLTAVVSVTVSQSRKYLVPNQERDTKQYRLNDEPPPVKPIHATPKQHWVRLR